MFIRETNTYICPDCLETYAVSEETDFCPACGVDPAREKEWGIKKKKEEEDQTQESDLNKAA